MLIVRIYVNSELIGSASAIRVKGGTDPDDINTYLLDDQSTIKHRYGEGAAKLAERMMKHLHKTKRKLT